MLEPTPSLAPPPDPLVDNAVLLGGYALRAVRRRIALATMVFVTTVALTFGFLLLASPLYRVETRILANDTQVMKDMAQPARLTTPHGGENLADTAGAQELITSRDTLLSVVDSLD